MKRGLLVVALVAVAASVLAGQRRWFESSEEEGDDLRRADRHPGRAHRPDGWEFCRLRFAHNRREAAGSGWDTDYPRAGEHLPQRLAEITTIPIAKKRLLVVDVGDQALFLCIMAFASDAGVMDLTEEEAANAREYLARGGMIWFDDSWGTQAWNQLVGIIERIVPGAIIETPGWDHPIYHMVFDIDETLQVSNIERWLTTGNVRERDLDSPLTPLKIVRNERQLRVVVVITHNTDIADPWEHDSNRSNPMFFYRFAPEAYALAANIVTYALTH